MLREKERELDQEMDKVNTANDANEKMQSDIKHLWEKLSEADANINNKSNNAMRHEQRSNQADLEIIDLTNQVQGLKCDKKSLERDNCAIRQELEDERALKVQLQAELDRTKSLVNNFEGTKNELVGKLQNLSKEKTLEGKDRDMMSEEISVLKKQIIEKDQEIED